MLVSSALGRRPYQRSQESKAGGGGNMASSQRPTEPAENSASLWRRDSPMHSQQTNLNMRLWIQTLQ